MASHFLVFSRGTVSSAVTYRQVFSGGPVCSLSWSLPRSSSGYNLGMYRFSWAVLETALAGRARWKRIGREWHGPCPVRHIGKNTAWLRPADQLADGVLVGCRKCEPLSAADRRAHVEAISLDAVVAAASPPLTLPVASAFQPSPAVQRLWRAARSLEGTPGALYLRERRVAWGRRPFPAAVRWIAATTAAYRDVRPVPPDGASGLILYAYRGLTDRQVGAVQLEAIRPTADRILWPSAAPRVSLAGSRFDAGRQRFEVLDGRADRVFLVEGPLSALAAPSLFPELAADGWTVVGVAGWPGFRRAAVARARLVRVCPDGDPDGERAVERFVEDLVASGLQVLVDPVPPGADLLDLYRWGGSTVPSVPVLSGPPYPFLTATAHVQAH